MQKNVSQFGLHELIRISCGITVCVNSSPRWTYDDGIGHKGLNLQKVTIDNLQPIEAFLIDLHVMLEHFQLIGVQIVDNVLFEVITKVDGDATNSRKWLKDLSDSHLLEPTPQVMRNCLWDNRIPAFFIDGNALFEPTEEEVAFIEVSEKEFVDFVFFLEGRSAMIIILEVEVARMYL